MYNILICGPLLVAIARVVALALGDQWFKAIAGFIDRWKRWYGIVIRRVLGEAGSMAEHTRPWLDVALPQLLFKYTPKGIYNVDGIGLFYKLKSDKSLTFKTEKCVGGKKV